MHTIFFRKRRNGLFDGDGTLTLMLIAGVVTYGLSYVVRGLLGGVR